MPLNKTPWPNGLPAEFFRASWGIIRPLVCTAVKDFFLSSFLHTALNNTSLVLIPKRPGAESMKEFRPISCLNTVYKLISRVLADRLKQHLPVLIAPNQSAFVKDKPLLENVLLASEILISYHKESSPPRITLKVNISKAFDSVIWDFVLSVLQEYGALSVFIHWIKACICSPSFSISINGVTSGCFKIQTVSDKVIHYPLHCLLRF